MHLLWLCLACYLAVGAIICGFAYRDHRHDHLYQDPELAGKHLGPKTTAVVVMFGWLPLIVMAALFDFITWLVCESNIEPKDPWDDHSKKP